MAIKIENDLATNDVFNARCNHCGRIISYQRKDLRIHRNYPKGFIYCPSCKAPIAHLEENFVRHGESLGGEQDSYNYEQIRGYRIAKILLFSFGIPLLVLGPALLTLAALKITDLSTTTAGIIFVFPFSIGLSMVILGGVFSKKIRRYQIANGKV